MNTGLSIGSLFLEGLLSFFSPCVLPLVPLYISYLTRDTRKEDATGNVVYSRVKTLSFTIAFILGICSVFVIAGLGSGVLHQFFIRNTLLFQLAGGVILVLFGCVSLGFIQIPVLDKLHVRYNAAEGKMTYLKAWLMGFFFSFAWSPCIGPMLANAIVQAAAAETSAAGWMYIGAYAAGFICIFLVLGLFTSEALNLINRHRNIVMYTGKIAGIVIVGMGAYMLGMAGKEITALRNTDSVPAQEAAVDENAPDIEKYNFTLTDADGKAYSLSDFKGRTVVLNFFGTWCGYCNEELPHLEEIHKNDSDVDVLLIATPDSGDEGNVEYVESYMKERGYTMKILYDKNLEVTYKYGISGYPTTFILKKDGNFYGYIPGYVPDNDMDSFLEEAKNS